MNPTTNRSWPIRVSDRRGNSIYITWERWEHALAHPGMENGSLDAVLETIRLGTRKQDKYQADKFTYTMESFDLPEPYTHTVVVVKMGWQGNPPEQNNFVLTAYLVQKW